MIENYINRSVNCDCGKVHTSTLEKIVIKEGVIGNELVDFIKKRCYNKITVICDKNGYAVSGKRVEDALKGENIEHKVHIFSDEYLVPDERSVGNLIMGSLKDSGLFLAVGSGTVNDLTRYSSAVLKIPFITVGIAPSMDGYISSGSALIYNGLKLTFETHAPKAVFFEPKTLANAPMEMIGAGVGDLLGKISCLSDWKLSKIINDEWHCEFISNIVQSAIDKTLSVKNQIANRDDDAVASLLEALLLSGVCMDYAGNSRPASGCEHHMSHFWEMRYILENRRAVLHGTKVGIGTIISLKAYDYVSKLNPDFAKIKALKRVDYAEWEKEIKRAFMSASPEIIDLEKKAKKNDGQRILDRLKTIEEKWEDVKAFTGSVVKPEEIKDFLEKLGAATLPQDIGVERQMAKDAILYAKEIRDRYTVLQLLFDLGELDNFASYVIEEYYGKE